MEELRTFEYPFPEPSKQNEYECPCGKSYKSYPALYTHLKNKHQGKATGTIKKPNFPMKKRGRPSTNKSLTSLESFIQIPSVSQISAETGDVLPSITHHSQRECLSKIALIVNLLPIQEITTKTRLNQIRVMTEMIVFVNSNNQKNNTLKVGEVLAQFLKELSGQVRWQGFRQFYTLFMLFLQFISDNISFVNVLQEMHIETLCDYINEFIQNGVEKMIVDYQISYLQIFDSEKMIGVFSQFFQWLFLKQYSSYRIMINYNFQKSETKVSI